SRALATRDLLAFATTSRHIPDCRFLTSFGMTREGAHRNDTKKRASIGMIPKNAQRQNDTEKRAQPPGANVFARRP
ncbi:MAG: hypothetical protein V2L15_04155, partial [Desulfobacteraceae bacterium]|nr:hypothetical protein [Desulfobacteraceae bacterium]